MLKECRIIVGTQQQDGSHNKADVYAKFEQGVAQHLGGFTLTQGHGAWFVKGTGVVQREPVRIYDITMETKDPAAEPYLVAATRALAVRADQLCIYFRDTNGVVSFIARSATGTADGLVCSIR